MSVIEEINSAYGRRKLHMTLIDPASQDPDKSGLIASEAGRAGSDYIMIGGSTSVNREMVNATVKAIKKQSGLKTILFPGSSEMISENADAIFFMTLMNSREPKFLMRYQVAASRFLRRIPIETISMGYVIFEPGMTVGKVGQADLVPRDDSDLAASYAVAAEMFGMRLVYFESGSGSPTSVPEKTISSVKRELGIPLIVGGGIRDADTAGSIARAGADIIVTGTVAEKASSVYEVLSPIIASIRGIH